MPEMKREVGLKPWLAERYPIGALLDWAGTKHVPRHRYSFWYSMGGLLLFLLGLQIATGILLALYYHPTEEGAYKSVLTICGVMPFGWVVRSLHAWTASVMVAVAFVHLFSVWLLRSFRKPRELTWVVGFSIFGLLLAFGFSGYLLPWDELSFFATKVGTKIMGSVPVVGYRAMTFLRGGEEVTGETIGRFFAFHICVLPLLTAALVGLHLLFIQIQGVSVAPSLEAKQDECPKMPFFPDFMLHDFRVWAILFGVLVTLAVAFPWGIGRQANPLAPAPAGIRPEWFFLSMFQVFKLLPTRVLWIEGEVVGTILFLVVAVCMLGLPFLIQLLGGRRQFLVSTIVAIAAIAFLAGFTLLGYVTSEREKARDRTAMQSPASQKTPQDAASEKLLAQAQARIQKERALFLLYTVGLWGCIIFLAIVIHLRLAHAERCRRMGLQD